jgi:hypothetical protein
LPFSNLSPFSQVADIWVDIIKRLTARQVIEHVMIYVQEFFSHFRQVYALAQTTSEDIEDDDEKKCIYSRTVAKLLYTGVTGCLGHQVAAQYIPDCQHIEQLLKLPGSGESRPVSDKMQLKHLIY